MKYFLPITLSLLVFFTTLTGMVMPYGEEIKVVSFRPKPIIKGSINGEKTYFLLDTGADISILNLNDEEEFGFKTEPDFHKSSIQGVQGQKTEIKNTRKVDIYLGNQQIKTRFKALDIEVIATSIYHKTGRKISGIIGSDVMRKYGFVIDYSAHKVLIQKTK